MNNDAKVDSALFHIGSQVRAIRISKDMDQEHLAQISGLSRKAIARLENGGGASLKTLLAVLHELGQIDWAMTLAPHAGIDAKAVYGHLKVRKRVSRLRKSTIHVTEGALNDPE